MTKADLGLPSGIKDATYQQNRASAKLEYPGGFAFMSKAELRKAYESLNWENYRLKQEKEARINPSDSEKDQLEFSKENYIKVVLENLELNRKLTDLLKKTLILEKEETSRIRYILNDSGESPTLKIA
jgi:hypothetical protein